MEDYNIMARQIIPRQDYPKLVELYNKGYTLQAIGDFYGVSRERIRQLLSGMMDTASARKHFSECLLKQLEEAKGKEVVSAIREYINHLRERNRYFSMRYNQLRRYYRIKYGDNSGDKFEELDDKRIDEWLKD